MSLEVYVYGPGFGETILLRWPRKGGGWSGALVDGYSPGRGEWLRQRLKALEISELCLVVVTHPHLDHVCHVSTGMALANLPPRSAFYWPGVTPGMWMQFYDRLAAQQGGTLSPLASQIRGLFDYLRVNAKTRGFPAMDPLPLETIFEDASGAAPLRVTALGPDLTEIASFTRKVAGAVASDGAIDYEHREANGVSIALLVEYGNAQVVLGGDMEAPNWHALRLKPGCPRFRPSIVKVSHHGSNNGRIDGMWPKGGGFFDGMAPHGVALVTPWRQGGRSLPEESVLEEIHAAGFGVFVTGYASHGRPRYPDSHVGFEVKSSGAVRIISQSHVRTFA